MMFLGRTGVDCNRKSQLEGNQVDDFGIVGGLWKVEEQKKR